MALDQETMDQLLNTVDRFVKQRLRPLESQVGEMTRSLMMSSKR